MRKIDGVYLFFHLFLIGACLPLHAQICEDVFQRSHSDAFRPDQWIGKTIVEKPKYQDQFLRLRTSVAAETELAGNDRGLSSYRLVVPNNRVFETSDLGTLTELISLANQCNQCLASTMRNKYWKISYIDRNDPSERLEIKVYQSSISPNIIYDISRPGGGRFASSRVGHAIRSAIARSYLSRQLGFPIEEVIATDTGGLTLQEVSRTILEQVFLSGENISSQIGIITGALKVLRSQGSRLWISREEIVPAGGEPRMGIRNYFNFTTHTPGRFAWRSAHNSFVLLVNELRKSGYVYDAQTQTWFKQD